MNALISKLPFESRKVAGSMPAGCTRLGRPERDSMENLACVPVASAEGLELVGSRYRDYLVVCANDVRRVLEGGWRKTKSGMVRAIDRVAVESG